jgi:formylglycine-generating enzyme required for sulfatase activity
LSFAKDSLLIEITFSTYPHSVNFYGTEMVLIPQGPFWVGDASSNNTFTTFGEKHPFHILTDKALIYNQLGGLGNSLENQAGVISKLFPLGYSPFFCQKYEINQAQWVEFLNDLSPDQLTLFYPDATRALQQELAYFRSGIRINESGSFSTSTPYRAMGGLNWQDILAYLDWACLRPMSETEFEKACRGPLPPLSKEFAWGTQHISITDSLSQDGNQDEGVKVLPATQQSGWANAARPFGQPYVNGPVRQGFAATATSGRVQAGAGFYGNFELSGNVWEHCARLHLESILDSSAGDGLLDVNGRANQINWYGLQTIVRGGGFISLVFNDLNYIYRDLAVSDRFYTTYAGDQRRTTTGGRGVRSW